MILIECKLFQLQSDEEKTSLLGTIAPFSHDRSKRQETSHGIFSDMMRSIRTALSLDGTATTSQRSFYEKIGETTTSASWELLRSRSTVSFTSFAAALKSNDSLANSTKNGRPAAVKLFFLVNY